MNTFDQRKAEEIPVPAKPAPQQMVAVKPKAAASHGAASKDLSALNTPSREKLAALEAEVAGELPFATPRVKVLLKEATPQKSSPVSEESLALYVAKLQNRVHAITSEYLTEGTRLKIIERDPEPKGLIGRILELWRPRRSFEVLIEHSPCDVELFQVSVQGREGDFRVLLTPYESPGNNFSALAAKVAEAISTENSERLLREPKEFGLKKGGLEAAQSKALVEVAGDLGSKLQALAQQAEEDAKQLAVSDQLKTDRLIATLNEFADSANGRSLRALLKSNNSEIKMRKAFLTTLHLNDEGNRFERQIRQEFSLGYDDKGWIIEQLNFKRYTDFLILLGFTPDGRSIHRLESPYSFETRHTKEILTGAVQQGFSADNVEQWLTKEIKRLIK